jgi:hypothetical protein
MIIIVLIMVMLIIYDSIRWLNTLTEAKQPVISNSKVGTENAKQTQKNLDGGFSGNGGLDHPLVC